MTEKGVKATTTDGSEFTGDVIVGGDGIHSRTRSEMWRLAEEKSPGYMPAGEHNGRWLFFSNCGMITTEYPGFGDN